MEGLKNKKFSFGYEDTDKKIEINLYGLDFEIKKLESIEELESIDRNDENIIEAQLEKILGNGAIERINRKRISDGYEKLDLDIELGILGCIFEAYAKGQVDKVFGRVNDTVKDFNQEINNNINREQRRNYNRNSRGYKGNRNYRRY